MNTDDVLALLQEKVTIFNQRLAEDEKFANMIAGKERSICITLSDGPRYLARLADGRLAKFGISSDDGADIRVSADLTTMGGMLDGTVSPLKAYATRKLGVKCSLRDLLLLKRIF